MPESLLFNIMDLSHDAAQMLSALVIIRRSKFKPLELLAQN